MGIVLILYALRRTCSMASCLILLFCIFFLHYWIPKRVQKHDADNITAAELVHSFALVLFPPSHCCFPRVVDSDLVCRVPCNLCLVAPLSKFHGHSVASPFPTCAFQQNSLPHTSRKGESRLLAPP